MRRRGENALPYVGFSAEHQQRKACRKMRSGTRRMKKQEEPGERREGSSKYNKQKTSKRRLETLNKAKEIVMNRFHMTEAEAHRYIQKRAMDSRKGIVEVSEMIIVLYGD